MAPLIGRLRVALYLVAIVFVVTPTVDIVANVVPLHLDTMQWRFGATGVASNYLISIIFGAALAATVAVLTGSRLTLRVLATLGALGALFLVVAGVVLLLDTLQLRSQVPPESLDAFEIGAGKTLFKLLETALVLAVIGWAMLKGAQARGKGGSDEPAFLVHPKKA